VSRPKKNKYPDYMTAGERGRGGFRVRNPITGKRKRFATEEEARRAAALLAEWVKQERQLQALDSGRPTIARLVKWWISDRLPFQPWDKGTRENMLAKMRRIERMLGERVVERTDCLFLEDWLASFCKSGDQFNKWRYALVLLWTFAVSRKLAATNEAEKIIARSTSKKLEFNRKVRQPFDVEGFRAVHAAAPAWLALAMELSLLTLQARGEVCSMRHADFRDGYLFVIRDKVSAESDMAFIKIKLTDELEELRRRALTLDNSASPFVVHRKPARRRRQWIEGKPHWTYVNPGYLSHAFEDVRDATARYDELRPRQRPSFHEIRGLGSRLMRDRGVPESAIQALMTHAHKRTTQIYLDGGLEALSDADFVPVATALKLSEILGGR
jgi:enterobacteria phage integrase